LRTSSKFLISFPTKNPPGFSNTLESGLVTPLLHHTTSPLLLV
jgi:hypothetical protein